MFIIIILSLLLSGCVSNGMLLNRISELEDKVENLERSTFIITEEMPYMPMIELVQPIYEYTEEDKWKFEDLIDITEADTSLTYWWDDTLSIASTEIETTDVIIYDMENELRKIINEILKEKE